MKTTKLTGENSIHNTQPNGRHIMRQTHNHIGRSPSKDQFAERMMDAIRKAGETRRVEYDPGRVLPSFRGRVHPDSFPGKILRGILRCARKGQEECITASGSTLVRKTYRFTSSEFSRRPTQPPADSAFPGLL